MSSEDLIRPGLTTPCTRELGQIKLRLRKKVPKLTTNDIRRARILYYEAITSELYEEGHINAAYLLLHLIEYEDKYVRRTSNPAVEERRLRNSRPLLNYLRTTLAVAETEKQLKRYDKEVASLLAIAQKFTSDPEKHWLAHQLFLISLDRCMDCCPPERMYWEVITRYYYAKFLTGRRKHLEALQMLEQADIVLEGTFVNGKDMKTSEENGENLTVLISTLLFEVNRQLAEACKESPAWIPEQYIRAAHKSAIKTRNPSIMAESYFSYGEFFFTQGRYQEALEMYKNASEQSKLDGNQQELLCSVTIARAASYHRIKQPLECEVMFQLVDRLTRTAEGPSLCQADYYFTSAALELEDGPDDPERIEWLAERLRQAGNTFRHFGREDKTSAARCLEALVRAERSFGEYSGELLQAAISTSDASLYRVIDWVGF